MTTLWEELIKWPFGIAAAGVAALTGYWIWLRQQRRARRDHVVTVRENAYREVWEALQRAEIQIRAAAESGDVTPIDHLFVDVNGVIMKNEFVLEPDDRTLSNEYLASVKRLADLLRREGSPEQKRSFATTAADGGGFGAAFFDAWNDLSISREKVLSRVRVAMTSE